MRSRRLKSIALFSGSLFLLFLLLFSTHIYAVSGSSSFTEPVGDSRVSSGTTHRQMTIGAASSVFTDHRIKHSRMDGKAGHNDKHHFETDLFAGANKAGVPAASQALNSD